MFEVDGVGVEVSCGPAVVASSLIIAGGVCVAVVCVIFCAFFLSACFHGMIVHFVVCEFVLLASVSSSASSSIRESATATISASGVESRSGGCISDFSGKGRSLGVFADRIHTLLGGGSRDVLFKDLDGCFG